MTPARLRLAMHDAAGAVLLVLVAAGTSAALGIWLGFAGSVAWRIFKWLNP